MVDDMYEPQEVDILVIGGGVFGSLTAIELSKKGFSVKLLEKNSSLMMGASLNNQNRLHLGYHYPRDLETAKQCQRGFEAFKARYPSCILGGFPNVYLISNENSNVTFEEYISFCRKANLPRNTVDLKTFEPLVNHIEGGLHTDEVIYDCKILRGLVIEELSRSNVDWKCDVNVNTIKEELGCFISDFRGGNVRSKAVVNCTFSNLNSFNSKLGLKDKIYQYELTIVPIIKWQNLKGLTGVTVMDGRFFTVLPHGKSGNYLLYHVEHTVKETVVGSYYPAHWASPKHAINNEEAQKACEKMINAAIHWLPDLKEAEYVDYLAAVRVVLADEEATDRRPSLIEKMDTKSPFYTIFSGKIDHSIWVSKDLADKLQADLG